MPTAQFQIIDKRLRASTPGRRLDPPLRVRYTFLVKLHSSAAALVLFAATVATLLPAGSRAMDLEPRSLKTLVISSDVIVVGKIVRTTMVDRENDLSDISYNHTSRYTAVIATIQVDETLKGDATGTVKFIFPKRSRISGEQVYDAGADGVWLLHKADKRDEFVADEAGRYQPRERKEQVKAIIAASRTSAKKSDEDSDKTP